MKQNFEKIVNDQSLSSTSISTTCSKDMRSEMPACHQFGEMWCWATAVAAVTQYYGEAHASQCTGLECKVVGWTFQTECCPYSSHVEDCGSRGAYLPTITTALNHFTSKEWSLTKSALTKATLDATLQQGNPVVLGIGPHSSPNHIVTVHGCDGNGNYWFHDPERNYGEYLLGDYNWLVKQCYAWVDKSDPKLVHCIQGSAKLPNEIVRIEMNWLSTHYIAPSTVKYSTLAFV
mmetsp:Transcript_34451/g.67982  ORF Transcript_34451/g.67982 Transcript_34451/m.67982 type:complete len:233 (-) Transcript_34451:264-962(-)